MSLSRLCTLLVALAAVALSLTPLTHAQANITGSIRGSVTDDSGNFLPGATVALASVALGNAVRTAITNEEGAFVINGLPVGVYSMTVSLIGYRPFEIVQIVVNPDESRTFNLKLPEGLSEKVTVQAERPVVDTSSSSSKEIVDATYVNRLPLISRRYQQILTLFPGVSNDEGFTLAQFHVNGSRVTQNGFRLDGATINDSVTGTFGLNVNQNAIERFEMNTSGFLPEYGEQSGGIANIITKSGTNTFEVLYSGFIRNDSWGSSLQGFDDVIANADSDGDLTNNNNPRPESQQWQEVSFTGPLAKNRAWFASSFQYWQEDIGSVFNDSERTGDRFHGQFKTTWQISPDNTFVVNMATDPSKFENLITDARFGPGTNYDQTQGGYFIQLRDTHTLSPSMFLETQLFAHHQYLTARPSDDTLGSFQVVFSPGLPRAYQGTYPYDQDRSTDRIRLSSAVTIEKGTHRIKTGFDYSFLDFTGIFRAEDVTLNFDAYVQGLGAGSTLRYINDYRNAEKTDRVDGEADAFIQDTWVINEKWTVEGGVRWDHQTVIGDQNFAPRAGVVFDPRGRGKTKVYANYGRFYDNVFTSFVDYLNTDGYSTTYELYNAGTATTTTGLYADYDYVVDGELKSPYKDSWTVGFEQELPWSIRVGVSHTQWEGRHQMRTSFTTDLSNLPPGVTVDPGATAAIILDTRGESDYSDLKLSIRKPFSHRFELIGSYTRSRVRGDSSDDFGFENRADAEALKFSRLAYDRPDIVNLSAFGNLPFGLEVTGIFRYQSGRLYSPLTVVGGQAVIDTSTGDKNSERMPPVRSLDLSLSKRFVMSRSQMKITAQVFNLTNELNVIDVERFSGASTFQGPVDVDFGRILQVGLEFRF
ncbi:MAG TPA: TonB-dependent receptor [Candidatus Polarisedimenticolia bacterium]